MENKEYKGTQSRGPRGGFGHGPRGNGEKAKNLTGTWKKLFGYCNKYLVAIIIALVCAALGTILTLMGPSKLSDMTEEITAGIAPDMDVIKDISDEISNNTSLNMETVIESIVSNVSDQSAISENASKVMSSDSISDADKEAFNQVMMNANASSGEVDAISAFASMPESVLDVLFNEIEVNDSVISGSEQMASLEIFKNMDKEDESDVKNMMNELPDSIKTAMYSDITIKGTVISADDQMELVNTFSNLDLESDDKSAALEAMDNLPDSIYGLVKPSIDMDNVLSIAAILIAMYAFGWIFQTVQGLTMVSVTQRVSKRMRSDISKKINRLPMWFYNKTSTGDVLSRVTNDVDMIGQSLNQSLGNLIHAVILFAGSFIMMIITDGWMTLAAVASSLIGFILMFAIMGRSQKYFARQQACLGDLNGHIEEMYAGHTVVKAYNGEENSISQFNEMNLKLRESGFKAQCLAGFMQPIMGFIGNLGYVAVCVVGGALAMNGKIGFGVIVAFMMYVRYFTQPLSQIAQAMQTLQSAAAAGERVFEFLEAEEMEDESKKTTKLAQVKGTVEFDHVKFGYEDSDEIIIHDFSAVAKPGQKIAIVGPTGAGKTTMVNLLMRFHEIQGGEIRIDGTPTKNITREDVHDQFCMVLQDTWLFEGTVRENLVYCTENISDEKIIKACKAVGLDHFIRTLPNGYDTILNDQTNLSQGQKQQLTLARAMIADKPMLILDEATSSVDTRTEQQIQSAMDKLMENRTSFVIAHRLSTIKNSDLILVMKNGDIIESGTHDELLAKKGFYADLYNSQFEEQVS